MHLSLDNELQTEVAILSGKPLASRDTATGGRALTPHKTHRGGERILWGLEVRLIRTNWEASRQGRGEPTSSPDLIGEIVTCDTSRRIRIGDVRCTADIDFVESSGTFHEDAEVWCSIVVQVQIKTAINDRMCGCVDDFSMRWRG